MSDFNIVDFLQKFPKLVEELELEDNTTSNVPPINKPINKEKEDSLEEWYDRKLQEINYNQYKQEVSPSGKQELNSSIKTINGLLYRVEKLLDHNIKLSKEKDFTPGDFWKVTKSDLNRIDSRINRIIFKLRKFR